MIGELSGPVTSYPLGSCPRHNALCISKNGQAMCLLCDAERAKAESQPGEVNTFPDPGHEAMKDISPEVDGAQTLMQPLKPNAGNKQNVLVPAVDFKEHLSIAIAHLKKSPMPSSAAQFKSIQKAIALLEKVTGEI